MRTGSSAGSVTGARSEPCRYTRTAANDGMNSLTGSLSRNAPSRDQTEHGSLRCLVTRRPDQGFDARYHATYSDWCGTLGFEYTVPMTTEDSPDGWRLHGSADLGWLAGGVYEYDGLATVARFFCNYQAREDHGVFKLERPR